MFLDTRCNLPDCLLPYVHSSQNITVWSDDIITWVTCQFRGSRQGVFINIAVQLFVSSMQCASVHRRVVIIINIVVIVVIIVVILIIILIIRSRIVSQFQKGTLYIELLQYWRTSTFLSNSSMWFRLWCCCCWWLLWWWRITMMINDENIMITVSFIIMILRISTPFYGESFSILVRLHQPYCKGFCVSFMNWPWVQPRCRARWWPVSKGMSWHVMSSILLVGNLAAKTWYEDIRSRTWMAWSHGLGASASGLALASHSKWTNQRHPTTKAWPPWLLGGWTTGPIPKPRWSRFHPQRQHRLQHRHKENGFISSANAANDILSQSIIKS